MSSQKSQEGYNLSQTEVQFQVGAKPTHRNLGLHRRTAEDVGSRVKALGQGVHAPVSNTTTKKKVAGHHAAKGGRTGQHRGNNSAGCSPTRKKCTRY